MTPSRSTPRDWRATHAVRACGWLVLAVLLAAGACDSREAARRPIRMATTTSTANTGLLDSLLAVYEHERGRKVEFIAVGTGMALRHGEEGDVDLLLVHAPDAEEAFVAAGYGVERVPVMWNDFVVLGPSEDPANVRSSTSPVDALRRIATAKADFISRGDDSGTHKKERALWQAAGIEPTGSWYLETGQGMGATLTLGQEKRAYTLSDRGTFLARRDELELVILFEGDPALHNPYALIAISPERYPDRNHAGARDLIAWMTSSRAQALIAEYRVNGHQLFHPAALPASH